MPMYCAIPAAACIPKEKHIILQGMSTKINDSDNTVESKDAPTEKPPEKLSSLLKFLSEVESSNLVDYSCNSGSQKIDENKICDAPHPHAHELDE
eukprot:8303556-Ditylum_brightwellii.AAC.1